MSLRKIVSVFVLTATLSVFGCWGDYLLSELSAHVLAKNDTCSTENHCLDDCVACGLSLRVANLDKTLPGKDELTENLSSPPTPDFLSSGSLVFEIYPQVAVFSYSLSPPRENQFTYHKPHQTVKNVVMII